MVRYIDKNSGGRKSDLSPKTELPNKNIISKAIQQEIQKKQDALTPESEQFLNKGLILQEKDQMIERLKEEKKELQIQLKNLSDEIQNVQKESQASAHSNNPTIDPQISQENATLTNKISELEKQLVSINELLSEKDSQIVKLSSQSTNSSPTASQIIKNTLKIFTILILIMGMIALFFLFRPAEYEAHISIQTTDIPGLDFNDPLVKRQIVAINNPQTIRAAIEQTEILPIDAVQRENKITKLLQNYEQKILINSIDEKKIIELTVVANAPEKASQIANQLANSFIENTTNIAKKETINQQLNQIHASIKDLEEKSSEINQFLKSLKEKNHYQEVSLPTFKKLSRKQPSDFIKIQNELTPLNSQIETFNQMIKMREASDNIAFFNEKDLSSSPILKNLLSQLKIKEFNRAVFLLDNSSTHPILKEQAKTISQLKANIVAMMKVYLNKTFTPDAENDLTLSLIHLFKKTKQQALDNIVNQRYIDEKSLKENHSQIITKTLEIEELQYAAGELEKQKDVLQKQIIAIDQNSLRFLSLTTPASTKIALQTKILYLLFCSLGIPLGLVLTYMLVFRKPKRK